MANMTWKEFKDAVDKQLAEEGISENEEIEYIDFSFPNKDDFEKGELHVGCSEFGIGIC